MSTKLANHFLRRYNWKEINNLFCYDVIFPERLSKKQQILRLYKNTLRRVYEEEVHGTKVFDANEYAKGSLEVRKDFEKLKEEKTTENDFNEIIDKYEYFIEQTFDTMPLFRDNVTYEWRHEKGMWHIPDSVLESDPIGYYSQNKENYYPKDRTFEFRTDFPKEEYNAYTNYVDNGWDNIDINDSNVENNESVSSPNAFKDEVEALKKKYSGEIELWQKSNKMH